LKNFLLLTFVAYLLSSCQTPGLAQSETLAYQKSLLISEMGSSSVPTVGMVALDYKDAYHLTFEAKEVPKNIRVSNCHRDLLFENVKTKKFVYYFEPTHLERGDCLLHVTFLDANNKHQYGAVSFRDDGENVPAIVQCNGAVQKTYGASVCQARAGTIQGIDFSVKMRGKTETPDCEQPTRTDKVGNAWQLPVKSEVCLYLFESEDGDLHKLTTFGYDDFITTN